MKAFKVDLKHAEKAKKELLEEGIYHKEYLPKKEKSKIFFPVKKEKEINVKGQFVETVLQKTEKLNTYKELLEDLPEKKRDKLPSSYDIIGNIIIIEIPDELKDTEKRIAKAILETHSQVKTVLKKASTHSGEFRTQNTKHLGGERKKETTYKENNTTLKLDVDKTYFSSRLSTERKRIYSQVKKGESILVMFSGVGSYPLTIARNSKAKRIVGIEKNPVAHKYAEENKKLNKSINVEFIEGDVRKVVPTLTNNFDRIIMPLPKDAEKFLDLVPQVAKDQTIIHIYVFNESLKDAERTIKQECKKQKIKCNIISSVVCGQYSPSTYRICVDFKVHAH